MKVANRGSGSVGDPDSGMLRRKVPGVTRDEKDAEALGSGLDDRGWQAEVLRSSNPNRALSNSVIDRMDAESPQELPDFRLLGALGCSDKNLRPREEAYVDLLF